MTHPMFSIVIPTRERASTLRSALQTCLEQDFESFEVVVFDNCSSDATRQAVMAFADDRIKYRRSDVPLAMQDSWNTAYTHAVGEWIIFIGDDDAMTPFGLRQLARVIGENDVDAVRWNYAIYSWPNVINPAIANYLSICVLREKSIISSRSAISGVMDGTTHTGLLPNVYHGAVRRDMLERIRAKSGVVFSGFHPDTYTSFAVAYMARRHLSITIPISISGFSKASNNIAFSFERSKHENAAKQRAENISHGIEMHPWVPDLPSLVSVLYDSFLRAREDLFADDPDMKPDRRRLAERLLRELPIDDVSEWPAAVAEIRRSLSDDPELADWFDDLAAATPPAARPRDPFRPRTLGYGYGTLHIDAAKCGFHDIVGAAHMVAGILNYDRDDLSYDLVELIERRERRSSPTLRARITSRLAAFKPKRSALRS